MSAPKQAGVDQEPRWKLFRKTRGGVALTREQVKEIKTERKKLRKEMKAAGIKSKYEFETTASSLGLYFDKRRGLLLLLFGGKGLWWLLGAALLLLLVLFAMGMVSQLRGYFTVNLSGGLFRKGFVLSETKDFAITTSNLFCDPAEDVPCISIASLKADIDNYDGQHNGYGYFAYTYYLRNEGEETVDYNWELQISGESLDCSRAAWVMVIEDGEMLLFAEPHEDGTLEALPRKGEEARGYRNVPVMSLASDPSQFMEPIKTVGDNTYYRITPLPYFDEITVAVGSQKGVEPMEVHKYTVVIWLEGDDPECTDELIGGHLGLQMQYALDEEEEAEKEGDSGSFWHNIWDSLIFWED